MPITVEKVEKLTLPADKAKNATGKIVVRAEHKEEA